MKELYEYSKFAGAHPVLSVIAVNVHVDWNDSVLVHRKRGRIRTYTTMDNILAVLTIISLTITGSIAQDGCPVRDPSLSCERSCTPDTGCRKVGRLCECAGECGWSCIRQGCPSLSAPENGGVTIDSDDRSIGSTANYTCNDGYILQGTPVRTCQENKEWSEGDEVSCECTKNNDEVNRLGRDCARPCPSDGICLQADYSCICDGICGKSCIAVGRENYCDTSLLSANHATYTVDPQTAEYGSIAKYTCVDGYSPAGGDSERTCTGGKSWNGSALVCWPNPGSACFDPPVVENANHNGSKEYYMAGELLTYTCDHGYYRDGSLPPLLRCQQTGDTLAWGNFDMTCLPTSCGPPEGIDHGRIEGSIYSFLSSVTYVCDIGYRIQGRETRRCQADQEWSGSLPQCNPIPESQKCSMQQEPPDGQWVRGSGCQGGQSQFPGCELSYTCNGGYVPANTGVVYVCLGPAWDRRKEPLCKPEGSCDNSDLPGLLEKHGSEHDDLTENGGWIQVKCEDNLELCNGDYLWCDRGKWEGNAHCTGSCNVQ
ncbi:Protein lev-9 [Holothuria leucospilota]|uniref:Protein lev-9 n=1 Tax=Holothuria leucospilota TaxID=206669 RepID=A0A9Q1C509_HOLLE|nr:Protein lev-9 [Holothuria leucospilota]